MENQRIQKVNVSYFLIIKNYDPIKIRATVNIFRKEVALGFYKHQWLLQKQGQGRGKININSTNSSSKRD